MFNMQIKLVNGIVLPISKPIPPLLSFFPHSPASVHILHLIDIPTPSMHIHIYPLPHPYLSPYSINNPSIFFTHPIHITHPLTYCLSPFLPNPQPHTISTTSHGGDILFYCCTVYNKYSLNINMNFLHVLRSCLET